ncbi:MAG: MarR family transcriptional regulator [Eubacteriales bacterium]|nr:MarR family transcriptional regulator [Eubacteriales bacterium]
MKNHRENKEHNAWHKAHYDTVGTNDKLVINLRDLGHTMRLLYEGKGSQKRVLIILDEIGGSITQRKLTERLGIQPGSASEVIAKLESAGYIKRTPNETDRRTADIALTETGKVLAAEARAQRIHRHEQMFACLSDAEKNELLSLLERINADWEKRYRGIADGHDHCEHHHENIHRQRGE